RKAKASTPPADAPMATRSRLAMGSLLGCGPLRLNRWREARFPTGTRLRRQNSALICMTLHLHDVERCDKFEHDPVGGQRWQTIRKATIGTATTSNLESLSLSQSVPRLVECRRFRPS